MNEFRNDFLWGTSVSSMQTEGAVREGGKGLSVYDDPALCVRGKSKNWEVAIDDYHRYDEDIKLLSEMNFNCYRFSVSWSRIFPDGDGTVNEEGLKFYDSLINCLLAKGIEPMICLYHFDMPAHLARKYNGFASRHVVDAFFNYGKTLIDRYKNKVKYWITFNEQNIFGWDSSIGGSYLPMTEKLLYQINHNVFIAHARIVNYLHQCAPRAKIGGMIAYQLRYPATTLPKDQLIAQEIDERLNQFYFEVFTNGSYPDYMSQYLKKRNCFPHFETNDAAELRQAKVDFLSFSYYASSLISANKIPSSIPFYQYDHYGRIDNELIGTTEWNWQIDPIGFRMILVRIANRYHLPVFPIENGVGVKEELDDNGQIDDWYRIEYHREHINEMKKAVRDGVNCLGYLSWGGIDIVSSGGQMSKRYGFVFVNRDDKDLRDLKRIPKKSFYWMKKVVETNGEDLR